MHPIGFAFKRAHLRCVAFGAAMIRRVRGMTPASFDVMYAIRTNFGVSREMKGRTWLSGVQQHDLWKRLGLHPSTISKLLRRLRELGWVDNEKRSPSDGRTKHVFLTDRGRRRIERAMRIVFQQHTHLKAFEEHFKRGKPRRVLEELESYRARVEALSRHFGDRASSGLYTFDYDPHKAVPAYMLFDTERAWRRSANADDWTSYRDRHKCADPPGQEACVAAGSALRGVSRVTAVARRRRCLVTFARASDRPESRVNIMMMGVCAWDPAATAREETRLAYARRKNEEQRRIAADRYLLGYDLATAGEARFRAGDPKWYVPDISMLLGRVPLLPETPLPRPRPKRVPRPPQRWHWRRGVRLPHPNEDIEGPAVGRDGARVPLA